MIRKMNKEDYNDFIEMANLFYKSSALEIPLSNKIINNIFTDIVNESNYIKGFIILSNNKVAGFATISFGYATEFGGKIILFEDLYIKPKYQGLGLGSLMFKYLEEHYDKEVVAIKLEVSRANTRALKLYETLGYRVNDYISMVKEIGVSNNV